MAQPADASKIFWLEMGTMSLYRTLPTVAAPLRTAWPRPGSPVTLPPLHATHRPTDAHVSHVVKPSLPTCLRLMKNTDHDFIPHDELKITRLCETLRIKINFSLAPTLCLVIFSHYLVSPPSVKGTVFHFIEQEAEAESH